MKKYTAHFDPQVLFNDYAMSVDPLGLTSWDCTAFLKEDPELRLSVDLGLQKAGEWFDENDRLAEDPAAPRWAKQWVRLHPFTITVEAEDEA